MKTVYAVINGCAIEGINGFSLFATYELAKAHVEKWIAPEEFLLDSKYFYKVEWHQSKEEKDTWYKWTNNTFDDKVPELKITPDYIAIEEMPILSS